MKKLFVVTVTGLLSFPLMAQIDKLGWYPDSAVSLGKGITKSFPLRQHLNCLDESNSIYKSLDGLGRTQSVSTNMKIQIVTENRELDSVIGFSGNIAAHTQFSILEKFDVAAVKIGGGFGKRDHLKEDSVALTITVEADYGRYEMKQRDGGSLELKPKYQAMIDSKNYDQFIQQCGTHVVTQENRKGLVTAIIKVSGLSNEKKKQIAASLQLSPTLNSYQPAPYSQPVGQDGSGTANEPTTGMHDSPYFGPTKQSKQGVSLGMDKFLKAATDVKGNIEIIMVTRGGGGMGGQTKIFELASSNDGGTPTVSGLMSTIDYYLRSFNSNTADTQTVQTQDGVSSLNYDILPGAAAEYLLTSYELYGLPKSKIKEVVNNELLEELYYLYLSAIGNYNTITKQIESLNDEDGVVEDSLMQAKIKYEQYIRKLWDLAKNILDKDLGNDPAFAELPAKPKFKNEEFSLSATVSKAMMMCSTGANYFCGVKANTWLQGGMALWKTNFHVAGKVTAPHLLQTLVIRQLDEVTGTVKEQLISINVGDQMPYASLSSDGTFFANFAPLDQLKSGNQELYVKYRKKQMARFEIVLIGKDGVERKMPITNITLEGRHLPLEQIK